MLFTALIAMAMQYLALVLIQVLKKVEKSMTANGR